MNEPYDADSTALQSPKIIIVATDEQALLRAENGFSAAFVDARTARLMSDVGMDELDGHAVWLEVGDDLGDPLDHWLMAFDAYASHAARPVSVALTAPLVDIVTARLDGPFNFLVAPDALQRAGAVSELCMQSLIGSGVEDGRGLNDDRQLRRLSDEVARIAATLSRLSGREGGYSNNASDSKAHQSVAPEQTVAETPLETVRATIRARRLREKYFSADYFADPAWDMLLDLYAAQIAQHRVPVSSLCIAASVPATTALRWMKSLTDAGIFVRRSDPRDGRRVFVELSQEATIAMRHYFVELDGLTAA